MHDKNLCDVLPQPLPILPLATAPLLTLNAIPAPSSLLGSSEMSTIQQHTPYNNDNQVLDTECNMFSLFHHYYAPHFPSHNPETRVNLSTLSNIVSHTSMSSDATLQTQATSEMNTSMIHIRTKPHLYSVNGIGVKAHRNCRITSESFWI